MRIEPWFCCCWPCSCALPQVLPTIGGRLEEWPQCEAHRSIMDRPWHTLMRHCSDRIPCRWWGLVLAVCAVSLGFGSVLSGQTVFRSKVELVTLTVTATDPAKRYVTDLGANDFVILEDGRPQATTFFQKADIPLALALVLDTSASMRTALRVAQEAAIRFASQLAAEDVAAVVAFDSTVRVCATFTNDSRRLEDAIRQLQADGSTAIYNALYIALKELARETARDRFPKRRRNAIVLLSDGDDTSSLLGYQEVLETAARQDTVIYAIRLGLRRNRSDRFHSDAPFVLRELAERSGGRVFFPQAVWDLPKVYSDIRTELSSQYALAYVSANSRRDGEFRRIDVRVSRPGVVARARHGYYAPSR